MHTTSRRSALRAASLASAAVIALTSLAACGSDNNSSSSGSKTMEIGVSLPLTGPVADIAKSGYQGYKLWASDVNKNGGILGRKVKLNVLDNGFDPNQTASDYTRLIGQDHVDLLLGTFSSLLNAPASAVAERQKMLYVEPSGGSGQLFTRGFKYLFFAQPGTTASLPDNFVDYISKLPADQKPKTVAYLTQDDPSTAPAIAVFKEKFTDMGITKVYDQTYDPSTSNFDAIAASIAGKHPDMIIQGSVADDGGQFVRSLNKVKFSPKALFQTNSPTDESYAKVVGPGNTEGIFTAEAWSSEAPYEGNDKFVADYTEKYGSAPTEDAANSYTAGQVLAAAVEAVGSTDQTKLEEWLHSNTVKTIVGPLKWDATGVPEGDLLMAQWQSEKLEIVAPYAASTSKQIVYPKPAWSN